MKLLATQPFAVKSLSALGVIFQYYLGKHCAYLHAETQEWALLFPSRGSQGPFHFEFHFGKGKQREQRLRRNVRHLRDSRAPFLDLDGDFAEAYAPVLAQGRYQGALVSGPVLRRCPTPDSLRARWKDIHGAFPGRGDPEFIRFVRLVLSLPCLSETGLQAYRRSLELLGDWLQDPGQAGLPAELSRQLNEAYSHELPHDYWVDWVIGIDALLTPAERERVVEPWVRAELGVSRAPTLVAAMMPQTGALTDTLQNLCIQKAFQVAAYRAVRQRGEMAAKWLGDFGLILVASASRPAPGRQQRAEIAAEVDALRRSVEAEIGCRVHAGLGRLSRVAGDLAASQREAVAAMNDGLATGQPLTLAQEPQARRTRSASALDRRLFRDLLEALGSSPTAHLLPRERLMERLARSELSHQAVRSLLVWAHGSLLDRYEAEFRMTVEQAHRLHERFVEDMDLASAQPAMFQLFRQAIDLLARPADGYDRRHLNARLAMSTLRRDIESAPEHPWTIKEICYRSGLSAPTVLKKFKESSGVSFGAFVRQRRMKKARSLLRNTALNLDQVARSSGYASASSFIQAFQRHFGKNPGAFR